MDMLVFSAKTKINFLRIISVGKILSQRLNVEQSTALHFVRNLIKEVHRGFKGKPDLNFPTDAHQLFE